MEITLDNTRRDAKTGKMTIDYRVINIMPGIHGYVENQAKNLCVLRDWHDTEDPEMHNPMLTPEIERELLQIRAEFEKLYDRAERLLMG